MSKMDRAAEVFANIMRSELDSRETDTAARIVEANLVTAILAKPLLALPQDLMVLTGCQKSTAYKIQASSAFPATFTLARQTFVRTDDFMAALPAIAGK